MEEKDTHATTIIHVKLTGVLSAGLYTDESPGLKVDPFVVLVLSVGFIISVVALHSESRPYVFSRHPLTFSHPLSESWNRSAQDLANHCVIEQSLPSSPRDSPHKLDACSTNALNTFIRRREKCRRQFSISLQVVGLERSETADVEVKVGGPGWRK